MKFVCRYPWKYRDIDSPMSWPTCLKISARLYTFIFFALPLSNSLPLSISALLCSIPSPNLP